MTVSKAQQASVNKYVKNNYDRINVTFPKGQKDIIKKAAASCKLSVNAYIVSAVNEKMTHDGFLNPEAELHKETTEQDD